MPAAKAPTIGDNPKTAANAEAPKHDAVAAASTTPSFPFEVKLIIFGRINAAKTVKVNHNAREVEITTITLNGVIGVEVDMNETMTPKIASPNTSSTTAALIIILDSIFLH